MQSNGREDKRDKQQRALKGIWIVSVIIIIINMVITTNTWYIFNKKDLFLVKQLDY